MRNEMQQRKRPTKKESKIWPIEAYSIYHLSFVSSLISKKQSYSFVNTPDSSRYLPSSLWDQINALMMKRDKFTWNTTNTVFLFYHDLRQRNKIIHVQLLSVENDDMQLESNEHFFPIAILQVPTFCILDKKCLLEYFKSKDRNPKKNQIPETFRRIFTFVQLFPVTYKIQFRCIKYTIFPLNGNC